MDKREVHVNPDGSTSTKCAACESWSRGDDCHNPRCPRAATMTITLDAAYPPGAEKRLRSVMAALAERDPALKGVEVEIARGEAIHVRYRPDRSLAFRTERTVHACEEREIESGGCEPRPTEVALHARCHMQAPPWAWLQKDGAIVFRCSVCGAHVGRFELRIAPPVRCGPMR